MRHASHKPNCIRQLLAAAARSFPNPVGRETLVDISP